MPLLTWAQAIHLTAAASNGISAKKLGEMLGVSYPTAWFMGHHIRAMMAEAAPILSGLVELDGIHAGAPPSKRAKAHRDEDQDLPAPNPTGRGTKRPLLLVAAEHGGPVKTRVMATHSKAAMVEALHGKPGPDAWW